MQVHNNLASVNLLLDMKAHWSSTFVMLYCAESHQLVSYSPFLFIPYYDTFQLFQAVNEFVLGLRAKETNPNKQCKIGAFFYVRSGHQSNSSAIFCR